MQIHVQTLVCAWTHFYTVNVRTFWVSEDIFVGPHILYTSSIGCVRIQTWFQSKGQKQVQVWQGKDLGQAFTVDVIVKYFTQYGQYLVFGWEYLQSTDYCSLCALNSPYTFSTVSFFRRGKQLQYNLKSYSGNTLNTSCSRDMIE